MGTNSRNRAAQDPTPIEAPLQSPEGPPDMLPPAGADAFPPGAPHAVPAYHPARWPLALARWWRSAFAPHGNPDAPATPRPRDDGAGGGTGPGLA